MFHDCDYNLNSINLLELTAKIILDIVVVPIILPYFDFFLVFAVLVVVWIREKKRVVN